MWTCLCGQRNGDSEAMCMAVGCGKPVRTTCAVCRKLVNNAAWACSDCGSPNPLRLIDQRRHQQLAHVALWACVHCKCTNDMAIRACASCMRPKPKFPTLPAGEQKKEGGDGAAAASATGEDRKEHTCVVCMDKEVNHVMVPCGHLCVCGECAKQLKSQKLSACPVCRRKPKIVQRVFYP